MADQPVTREKLINADIDVDNLGKAANELGTVNPRYGIPYKTAPQTIQDLQQKADEVVSKGFYQGYATEALLLAAKPAVAEMRARADDTRKIYRWNRTSAEGVTPITGNWVDTGLSELDLAKDFALTNSLSFKPNLSSENLNDVISIGIYRQPLDANATVANNYPNIANAAGVLEVIPTSGLVIQRYTTWYGRRFWRIQLTGHPFLPWNQIATKEDIENALGARPNLGLENIDTIEKTGIYRQLLDANATVANGYPNTANSAGVLEVIATTGLTVQNYTTWYARKFWRTKVPGYPFQPWQEIQNTNNSYGVKPNLGSENLETVVTNGIYRQANDSLATAANGYPVPPNNQAAGILEVITSGNLVIQNYTTWWGYKFWRIKIADYSFQVWNQVARITDIYKPFYGKKIAWFGDSIVEGNSHPNGVAGNLGATVSKFGFSSHTMSMYPGDPRGRDGCAMYRFANAINTGDWASVIASGEWTRDNLADDNMPQINAMVATDWNTIDYIVIAFGTNDWTSSTPLGSTFVADPTGSTFIGATCYVIEQIQKKYPHIQICFISPVFRTRFFNTTPEQNSDTVTDTEGKYLVDYVDALLKMKDIYHIPVYDFYRNSGINSMTYTQYLGDGVHPNTNGVQLWTNKITSFMNSN